MRAVSRSRTEREMPGATAGLAADRILSGPILVATDTSLTADLALRAASTLASSAGAPIRVVSVVEPLPFTPPPDMIAPVDPAVDEARLGERRAQVEEQLRRVFGAVPVPVEIRRGYPAFEIADAAREMSASLLVIGLSHHSLLDRLLGRETALQIIREAPVPVLALAGELADRPRRVLVGVDFTPASLGAARAAVAIAGDDARVQLLHVNESAERDTEVFANWYIRYRSTLDGDFALLESAIDAPSGTQLAHATVVGRVADRMLERAAHWDSQLIVASAHGGGMLRRLVVGSVTAQLIRRTTRPLLIVPASPSKSDALSPERKTPARSASEPTSVSPLLSGPTCQSDRHAQS